MKRPASIISLALFVALAACSSGDSGDTTTAAPSTTAAPVTSLDPTTTSSAAPTTSVGATGTTVVDPGDGFEMPAYTILSREAGEDGDTVVVLLDKESYLSLSDIDLANVLNDLVDRFPPILTAHVIDNEAIAEAVLAEATTDEEKALLAIHHLVRLEDGFRMVFLGPFADLPIAIIGS